MILVLSYRGGMPHAADGAPEAAPNSPSSDRGRVAAMSGDWTGVGVVVLTILASHAWSNREGALDGFMAGLRAKSEQNN